MNFSPKYFNMKFYISSINLSFLNTLNNNNQSSYVHLMSAIYGKLQVYAFFIS